jgi:hypothetical protein
LAAAPRADVAGVGGFDEALAEEAGFAFELDEARDACSSAAFDDAAGLDFDSEERADLGLDDMPWLSLGRECGAMRRTRFAESRRRARVWDVRATPQL